MHKKILSCGQIFIFLLIFNGCGYRSEDSKNLNHLADATSPYLRGHSDNPVHWYEWGDEPLQRAQNENKPLIISIGYASCHWCHVMEDESFMDTAVARMMNENFIAIKIDREQRPDIDQIYLSAAQLLSGSAGWPLNAFALPDGRPFYAGTYFPKEEWLMLLHQVSDAFRNQHSIVMKQAEALTEGVRSYDLITPASSEERGFDKKAYESSVGEWMSQLDHRNGGQPGAPKFPMPVIWESLLQHFFLTRQKGSLEIVATTLNRMAEGAIYDQIGGGFARYSTDSSWRVPHFEKMLYDNAQLVSLYSHAYQITHDPFYKQVVHETLAFIKKEMTGDDGAFYSSLNADSEGIEGKYYTWTKEEIIGILTAPAAAPIIDYYGITDEGNWEDGRNILYRDMTDEQIASKYKVGLSEWHQNLQLANKQLSKARDNRTRPSRDEKAITSWNALMIIGLLDAYVATSVKDYLDMALANAAFIETKMNKQDGGLWRNYSQGHAGIDAFLDDYALLALANLKLYQVTFNFRWLSNARSMADFAIQHFRDPETGLFFYTSDLSHDLVVRKMETNDQVIPSSNSVLSEVFFLLGEFYQDSTYSSHSIIMREYIGNRRVDETGIFHANWMRVAGMATWKPFEVVIMGADAVEVAHEMQQHFNPLAIFSGGTEENLPLLESKLVDGKTIIYVCRDRVCKLPVQDPGEALAQTEISGY